MGLTRCRETPIFMYTWIMFSLLQLKLLTKTTSVGYSSCCFCDRWCS